MTISSSLDKAAPGEAVSGAYQPVILASFLPSPSPSPPLPSPSSSFQTEQTATRSWVWTRRQRRAKTKQGPISKGKPHRFLSMRRGWGVYLAMGLCYALGARGGYGHSQGGSLQQRGVWSHPLASFFELRGTSSGRLPHQTGPQMGMAGQPSGASSRTELRQVFWRRGGCTVFSSEFREGKGWQQKAGWGAGQQPCSPTELRGHVLYPEVPT